MLAREEGVTDQEVLRTVIWIQGVGRKHESSDYTVGQNNQNTGWSTKPLAHLFAHSLTLELVRQWMIGCLFILCFFLFWTIVDYSVVGEVIQWRWMRVSENLLLGKPLLPHSSSSFVSSRFNRRARWGFMSVEGKRVFLGKVNTSSQSQNKTWGGTHCGLEQTRIET